MWPDDYRFRDRTEAGRALAKALEPLELKDAIVLALPRGGVPVAYEVASALKLPLDVFLVRKIGAPGHAEFGIGAVTDGAEPQVVLNEDVSAFFRPDPHYVAEEVRRQLAEMARRREFYMAGRPSPELRGRTVILVDDGIATGGTARASLRALRKTGASEVVLAVPVAPPDVVESMRREADQVVVLRTPEPFRAVGLHYIYFDQTSDEEVVRLLDLARSASGGPATG